MGKTGQLQRILMTPNQLSGDRLVLSLDQLHYLTRVLRLGVGNTFVAMFEQEVQPLKDAGPGRWWLSQLSATGATVVKCVVEPNNTVPVTVLLAITKGGGFDEVLRQLTELGVATITPVQTERTVVVPGANKLKRWRRIMVEAAEQCERSPLPQLLDPLPWAEALALLPPAQDGRESWFIAVARCGGEERSLLTALQAALPSQPASDPAHWIIAIGPEGGWTEVEKGQAIAVGFEPVSLGDRILRAVTASVSAMAIAAMVWETR